MDEQTTGTDNAPAPGAHDTSIRTLAQRNILGFETSPPVFITSAVLILGLALYGMVAPAQAEAVFGAVMDFIALQFGWFYTLAVSGFLVFVLWAAFSRYGHIRLGPDDARPDYSYVTWFAMLFGAGMGIGVLFWSVAEPLNHFANPPYGDAGTVEAARRAINLTYLHWGLHGWAIYVVVGLALSYLTFRHGHPMAMRSLLHPLIGERVYGTAGHVVDVFAILGTMFGVATTLGLGAQQIGAGLAHLFPVESGLTLELWIIALATLAATISVVTGLDHGIKRLSQSALVLALVMFAFVLIAGPTTHALTATVENVGYYIQRLPETALRGTVYADSQWMADWTLFYWGWWLAWSPFVGIFIARISRGRTVREFVFGVLLVPTSLVFLWYGVFGNMGLRRALAGDTELVEVAVDNMPAAIFTFFEAFPFTLGVAIVGILVILLYFVTSSDSASFVIDMLAAGGHPDPPRRSRVFWATSEGLIAAMLLIAGGLTAMRSFQIATGLPLAVLLIASCFGLVRALREDPQRGARLGERARSRAR